MKHRIPNYFGLLNIEWGEKYPKIIGVGSYNKVTLHQLADQHLCILWSFSMQFIFDIIGIFRSFINTQAEEHW